MCFGKKTTNVTNTTNPGAAAPQGASEGASSLAIGGAVDENGNITINPRTSGGARQALKIAGRAVSSTSGSRRGLPGGGGRGSFSGGGRTSPGGIGTTRGPVGGGGRGAGGRNLQIR